MNNKTNVSSVINITSIIDNIPLEDICLITNSCGTYVITYVSEEKYVGSTKNLRDRLNNHVRNSNPECKIKSVRIYITENTFDSRLLEKVLIKELKPEINKRDLFISKETCTIKIPNETYKIVKKLQASLYKEYDIKLTIGEIIQNFIKKHKESTENLVEWLKDSIKAERDS